MLYQLSLYFPSKSVARFGAHAINSKNNYNNWNAGQSPTRSPPGMCKRDCACLTYLHIGYTIAT